MDCIQPSLSMDFFTIWATREDPPPAPLQIGMFLKFYDQKLSSRDDRQTPYQSACHETIEKWRNTLCDYNPT